VNAGSKDRVDPVVSLERMGIQWSVPHGPDCVYPQGGQQNVTVGEESGSNSKWGVTHLGGPWCRTERTSPSTRATQSVDSQSCRLCRRVSESGEDQKQMGRREDAPVHVESMRMKLTTFSPFCSISLPRPWRAIL